MSRKPRTPEELAKERAGKKAFTLYLDASLMNYVKRRATEAGTSASEIVNEALDVYVTNDKQRSSNQKPR
jgi:hypothetical protein